MEELNQLHEDIHNLTEQIHKLEDAVAILICAVINQAIYGTPSVQRLTQNELIEMCERFMHIPSESRKLIDELGGNREFIEKFLNPRKNLLKVVE